MERILVTGANGYIGSHVVKKLLDMGYDVTAVDFHFDYVDKRSECVSVDLFDSSQNFYEIFQKPDRLVHLAWKDGFVHNSISHLENLGKHYCFIKSMVESGVKSVSVMGSMHEIGFYEGVVDEKTPTNPSSLYGISKNALRQALFTLQQSTPFSLKWLRGFYIFGDDRRNNSVFTKILEKTESGVKTFPFTTGTNRYDFISIEHLALEIALASVQDEVDGIINCCSGKSIALREKVEQFISENNLPIQLEYGVFPDRPYDSREIYGNTEKIKNIVANAFQKHFTYQKEIRELLLTIE